MTNNPFGAASKPMADGGGWGIVFGLNPDGAADARNKDVRRYRDSDAEDPVLAGIAAPQRNLLAHYADFSSSGERPVWEAQPRTIDSANLPVVNVGFDGDPETALASFFGVERRSDEFGGSRKIDGAGEVNPFVTEANNLRANGDGNSFVTAGNSHSGNSDRKSQTESASGSVRKNSFLVGPRDDFNSISDGQRDDRWKLTYAYDAPYVPDGGSSPIYWLPSQEDTEPKGPPDNGVDPVTNFFGQIRLEAAQAADAVWEGANRLYATAAQADNPKINAWRRAISKFTFGDRVGDWIADYSEDAGLGAANNARLTQERRKYRQELHSGEFSPGNPFAPDGESDQSRLINPAMDQSASSGVARAIPDLAVMATGAVDPAIPAAVFMAEGTAKGAAQAGDAGQSRAVGALKGAAATGATMIVPGALGKGAAKVLANRLTSPVARFAAGWALAAAGNVAVDAAISSLTGGHALPQTPAEWTQRGLFTLGLSALHGWHEATIPNRIIAAQKQLQLFDAWERHISENRGKYDPNGVAAMSRIVAAHREALSGFL